MTQTQMQTQSQRTNAGQLGWLLGVAFGALLLMATPLFGIIGSGIAGRDGSRVLVLLAWVLILLTAGAFAGWRGASGAITGAVAAGFVALLLVLMQLLRVGVVVLRASFSDFDPTGNRVRILLLTLVAMVVAAAIGALLGWLGARLPGRRRVRTA